MHKHVVRDSAESFPAGADYVLLFKRRGQNPEPIRHPEGLSRYAGDREVPAELLRHAGETRQEKNRLSQWIWRQYASCFWDDVRLDRVLPYKEAKEPEDERHVCPLHLDTIERCLLLWSNPGDTILSPFAGVGSELYGALVNGRKALGVELKSSYYRQALRNIRQAILSEAAEQAPLFAGTEAPYAEEEADAIDES
jgi:DNA modification methylase